MSTSIGFIPGDAPVRGRKHLVFSEDQSAEHVRFLASEAVKPFDQGSWAQVTDRADADGFVYAAQFGPRWNIRANLRDKARELLRGGKEAVIAHNLGEREKVFDDAISTLESAAKSSFSAYHATSTLNLQPAADAAKRILGLAEALEAKGHVPAEIIAGVRAAYAKAEGRIVAVATALSAASTMVVDGYPARGVEVTAFTKARRDALAEQLAAAKGRYRICRDKGLTSPLEAGQVLDHYLAYGEVHIGQAANDPHLESITSLVQLQSWCDRCIGKVQKQ